MKLSIVQTENLIKNFIYEDSKELKIAEKLVINEYCSRIS